MFKVNVFVVSVLSGLLIFCAPAVFAGGSQSGTADSGQGAPAVQGGSGASRPVWVDSIDSVYDTRQYLSAVGYDADRAASEKKALANLAAIFGQSIQADQKITQTYQEAVRNGVTAGWSDTTAVQSSIQTSTSMDTLVGAEIRDVWFDADGVYYAAAVMDKAKTVQVYTDMIRANQTMIANLTAMNQAEKNTLEGFSRYQFAAAAADINISYGNVLKVLGAAPPAALKSGDEYRLEAVNITKAIPVGVVVKNDRAGRIQGAFAKVLSELGFRSGGNNSRYIVEVEFDISEAIFPNLSQKFARYTVAANLVDTNGNAVLVPFNIDDREGHNTFAEAENRAVMAAERKILEEYKTLLSDYLSRLLPKK